jgi:hypothetical protein
MLPRLSLIHQKDGLLYFFVEIGGEIKYARVVRKPDGWLAQEEWKSEEVWEPGGDMKTCQFCAKTYDPKVTTTPRGYCSQECSRYGERPYTREIKLSRDEKIEQFARRVVGALHNIHSGDDRLDCDWDVCIEAKILGL